MCFIPKVTGVSSMGTYLVANWMSLSGESDTVSMLSVRSSLLTGELIRRIHPRLWCQKTRASKNIWNFRLGVTFFLVLFKMKKSLKWLTPPLLFVFILSESTNCLRVHQQRLIVGAQAQSWAGSCKTATHLMFVGAAFFHPCIISNSIFRD